MPATSRHGESGRTRSASGLAGSPSKSTIFQPLTVRSVWPRCRSPWIRCTRIGVERGAARRRRARRPSAYALELGHDVERGVEPARASRPASAPTSSGVALARPGSARPGPRGSRPAPHRAARPRRRSRRRPRRRAGRPRRRGCARWRGARSQPSVAVRRNCWSIASCRIRSCGSPSWRSRPSPASRRGRRRGRSRPGSAPRGSRCRGSRPG